LAEFDGEVMADVSVEAGGSEGGHEQAQDWR
jgi:hypothetical protein